MQAIKKSDPVTYNGAPPEAEKKTAITLLDTTAKLTLREFFGAVERGPAALSARMAQF